MFFCGLTSELSQNQRPNSQAVCLFQKDEKYFSRLLFWSITFCTVHIHPLINFGIFHLLTNLGSGVSNVIPFFLFFYVKKLKLKATLQSYIMTFCQVINKNNATRAKWLNCNNCNSKWDYFVKITETEMMQLFQVIQRCFRKDTSLRSKLCCFRTKKRYKLR